MKPVSNTIEIISRLRTAKAEFKRFGVESLGLFGSFSKSLERKESDIDFLVKFRENSSDFYNFMHLAYFLEDTLDRKVDLLTIDSLPENFKKEVEKEVIFLEV